MMKMRNVEILDVIKLLVVETSDIPCGSNSLNARDPFLFGRINEM